MHIAHVLRRLVLPRSVGRVVGFWAPDVGICPGLFGYFWHGYVAGVFSVVPIDGESVEEGTGPVDGDCEEFLEGLDEVVGFLFANVLDPKVINDEGENDGLGVVLPERGGSGNRGKAKMGEVSFESVVCDADDLFEAGHAFLDL